MFCRRAKNNENIRQNRGILQISLGYNGPKKLDWFLSGSSRYMTNHVRIVILSTPSHIPAKTADDNVDENDLAMTTAPKNEKKGLKIMQHGPKTIQHGPKTPRRRPKNGWKRPENSQKRDMYIWVYVYVPTVTIEKTLQPQAKIEMSGK